MPSLFHQETNGRQTIDWKCLLLCFPFPVLFLCFLILHHGISPTDDDHCIRWIYAVSVDRTRRICTRRNFSCSCWGFMKSGICHPPVLIQTFFSDDDDSTDAWIQYADDDRIFMSIRRKDHEFTTRRRCTSLVRVLNSSCADSDVVAFFSIRRL